MFVLVLLSLRLCLYANKSLINGHRGREGARDVENDGKEGWLADAVRRGARASNDEDVRADDDGDEADVDARAVGADTHTDSEHQAVAHLRTCTESLCTPFFRILVTHHHDASESESRSYHNVDILIDTAILVFFHFVSHNDDITSL